MISTALLACVRGDSDDETVRTCTSRVSGADLAAAAAFHRVGPLVHHRMTKAGLPPHPDLAAAYREQLFRQLVALAELRRLGAALDAAGISWLVFKGPILAQAYERDDLRAYRDVDVLVQRRQLAAALDVLYASGCTQIDRNWQMINDQTRGEMSLETPNGVSLDLHWDFVNERRTRLALKVPVDAMLARATTRVVNDVALPTLDPHDELAYVALHALLSGGHRLAWLVDMDRLVRARSFDWDEVVRTARASGLGLPLAIMLDRAHRYLGTDVPSGVQGRLASLAGWRGVLRIVDSVRSPVESFGSGLSGRIFAQSFRGTSTATFVGLLEEVAERLGRHRIQPFVHNPLHEDVPDLAARRSYLERVAGEPVV